MTITEAVQFLDEHKQNTCSRAQKLGWLSELDALTRKLLFGQDMEGYTEQTPPETMLQIPAPFDGAYLYYMESKIDYLNGEFTRFNNSYAMFRSHWQRYADAVVRSAETPQRPGRFQ